MHNLFEEIEKEAEHKSFFLRCSYVEIYNDQVYDLLRSETSAMGETL